MATTVKMLLDSKKISKVISIKPEHTVLEALTVLAEYNIGALVVMEGEKLVGIFSERDYARKGILKDRSAKSTTISEVMTPNVFTVSSNMTTKDCMQLMSDKHFRHLPVVDNEKVVGVLSVGDIVSALLHEQSQTINFLESYIAQ